MGLVQEHGGAGLLSRRARALAALQPSTAPRQYERASAAERLRLDTKKLARLKQTAEYPRNIAFHVRYIVGSSGRWRALMERRTETLNLRVTSELKELVRLAAEREHRSISNLIEVLVRDYCAKHGVKTDSSANEAPNKSAV